jgi:hypothetical protein
MKLWLALGTICLSAVAASQTPPSADAPNDRRICKSSPDIGSRLARTRRCFTEAEWAAHKQETRRLVREGQTRQRNIFIDSCVHRSCGPNN